MPLTLFHFNLPVLTMFLIVALAVPSASWGQVNKSSLTGIVQRLQRSLDSGRLDSRGEHRDRSRQAGGQQ